MNKKIFFRIMTTVMLGWTLLTNQSCDYLEIDQYINDLPTLDSVFQRRETTLQYLANVYSFLPDGGDPQPWVPVSDECLYTKRDQYSGCYNYFSNNTMSAYDKYFDMWAKYYQGIRNASIFLRRVYECQDMTSIQIKESVGEAHFLRAYFYFELMKEYGPVPLAPRDGFALDTPMDELLVPRNTWAECVDFIVEELNSAIANLPENRPNIEFGKPTKGAAYAMMSRLLLYNASPLFNGNTSYADFYNRKTGEPYFDPEYKEVKWAEAAWAALQVIKNPDYELFYVKADQYTPTLPSTMGAEDKRPYPDGAGEIDPYKSYSQLFNGTIQVSDNKEVIFGRPASGITKWVREMAPFHMGDKGSSLYNITQKLVDAYYTVDGRTIDNPSPEYPCDNRLESTTESTFSGYKLPAGTNGWYLNREARFYATVGFCNSYYYGLSTINSSKKNFVCKFFVDDPYNGKTSVMSNSGANNAYCMTGYLCRKFLHDEDHFVNGGLVRHKIWMEYRLAEIYLNYVEALNELTGSHTVNGEVISRNPEEIRKYFNMIRHRVGLPGISADIAANPEKVRELVRRERQIELAWEGHRYFDVRRWKIADVEENEPIYGVDINQPANNKEQFYTRVVVREKDYTFKVFTKRQNFWPIPNDEIVRNPNLTQSPGW